MVLEGEQCLETPEGKIRVEAGESMMVRGGIPMALYGTGSGIRRATGYYHSPDRAATRYELQRMAAYRVIA